MGTGPRGSTRLLLGGMAAAGVVAAHLLAYLFAVPDPHHRAAVLESTGHHNWTYVSALAFGLLVAGLLKYIVGSFKRGAGSQASYGSVAWKLVVLQLSGFVGIELLERASAAHSTLGLFSEPAIQLGLLLQVVVALAGAAVVLLLARAIRSVLTRWVRPVATSSTTRSFPRVYGIFRRSTVGTGAGTLRGPPLLLI